MEAAKKLTVLLACLCFYIQSYAQADDLMFVDYVDWNTGNGVGVTIYNPTSSTIDLTQYTFNVYNNGNTSPSGSYALTGTLAAGKTKVIGNTAYCSSCTCDISNTNGGVNQNDVVALLKSGNFVDMIGLYGYDPGNAGWKVGGVSNAHYQHRMTRDTTNCTRYTSTSGSGTNSWPNSTTTNVTGWTVSGVTCVNNSYKLSVSTSKPKINIPANDTVVCEGTVINFVADGSYKWWRKNSNATVLSTSAATLSISFPQNGTDTIFIEGSSCGVKVYDTLVVKVGAPFSFSFGPDSLFCGNVSLLLNPAIPSATYLWQDNSTNATFNASSIGTYWAKVTRDKCVAADTIILTLQNAAVPTLGADTSICAGDSIKESFSCAGCSYLWSTNETTSSINIKQANSYWLQVTDGSCKTYDTVNVSVKPLPTISLGADTAVCTGDSVVKSYSCLGCSYLWSTTDVTSSITVKQTGNYWLQVKSAGCTNADTVNITIKTPSPFSLGADTSACIGDSIIKSYTCAGCSYLWSTNSTAPSIAIKQAGNYWLQINDAGCKNTDTIAVTFNTLPTISLGADASICQGDSITKSYTCAGCSYLWSNNATTSAITIKQNGSYWLQVNSAGCKNSDTVIISQKSTPVFTLGSDFSLCSGDSAVLKIPLAGVQSLWSDNSIADTLLVKTSGTYWARATQNGCNYTDSINVNAVASPAKSLKDTSFCAGQSITVDAFVTGATYLWDDASTQSTRTINTAGKYRVALTLNGCSYADSALVKKDTIPSKPNIKDTVVCENATLVLNGTAKGAAKYLWNTGETTPIITLDSDGVYIVSAINNCGTTSDTAVIVAENCDPPFIPNVFTPNGDDLNDGFYIDFKNARAFNIEIYNRWGEKVFESKNPNFVWKGDFRGQLVPSGVYFYVIVSQTGIGNLNNTSGTITLIR